jgi:TPR repeat protein
VESAIRRHSSGIATIINRITIGLASFILGAGLSWSALTFAPLLGLPPFGPELATQLRHAVDETSGLVADFAYEAVYATAKASRAATTWVMNLVGVPSADQSSDAGVIVSLPTLDTGRSLDLTPVPPADTRSADSGAKRGDDRADPPPGRGTVLASAGVGTEVGDAASARASLAFPTVPQGPIDEGAVQRLEVRAKAGHAEAQHDLAMVYVQEFGRFRDISKAAFWFREAAVQGLANAQYNLGVLYDKGLGVERDEVRALLWYHSAAEQGHARAQFNLGVIYAEGRGIPLDYGEAFRWFRRAADQGIPRAYYNMAIMQAYGLGAPANSMSARAYLTRAALLGDVEARRTLADNDRLQLLGLAPSRRNAAEGRTTPEVVAAIQHLLNEQNLDAGPPDGVIGDGTRQAIRRYQNSAGLAVTGQPTTDLLDHMVSRVIR